MDLNEGYVLGEAPVEPEKSLHEEYNIPTKRQKTKGLAASELMRPSTTQANQSYIALKFSSQVKTKKEEMEDRLIGLISTKDRELLSLAEKNQYVSIKAQNTTATTETEQS